MPARNNRLIRYRPAVPRDQDRLFESPDDLTFTVADLTATVRDAFKVLFPEELWVEGEIASLSSGRAKSASSRARHVYFDLVTPEASHDDLTVSRASARPTLPVVLFDASRRRVNDVLREHQSIKMSDGVRVRIRGRLEFYPARAQVQFVMTGIDPEFTVALLIDARQRLLGELIAEGLLDRNRALAVPPVPFRIGLITSAGSAAEADFLHELRTSGLSWSVVAIDAPMQGVDAPRRIAAALRSLSTGSPPPDIIALVRGGGAKTDLAAFDHELIARTIAMLPAPVFTGIGHEVDSSVADAVAAVACKTPTACAAEIVGRAASWVHRSQLAGTRLPASAQRAITVAEGVHDHAASTLVAAASSRLSKARESTNRGEATLCRAANRAIVTESRRLDSIALTVRSLDPARTLERGFTITRTSNGTLVRDGVAAGTTLLTTTATAVLTSTAITAAAIEDAAAIGEADADRSDV